MMRVEVVRTLYRLKHEQNFCRDERRLRKRGDAFLSHERRKSAAGAENDTPSPTRPWAWLIFPAPAFLILERRGHSPSWGYSLLSSSPPPPWPPSLVAPSLPLSVVCFVTSSLPRR